MMRRFWIFIFGPFFLFSMIGIIKTYDYKFDVTGWRRFISYQGVNLQFLNLNKKQWEIFSKKLAPRYFKAAAIINIMINLIALLLVSDTEIYIIIALITYLFLLIGTLVVLKIKVRNFK